MFCAHQSLRLNSACFCSCLDIDTISEGISTNFYPHGFYILFSCVCIQPPKFFPGVVFSAQPLFPRGRIHFFRKLKPFLFVFVFFCLCYSPLFITMASILGNQITQSNFILLNSFVSLRPQSVDPLLSDLEKQCIVVRMCSVVKEELCSWLGRSRVRRGPSSPNTFQEHIQNYLKTFHQAPPLQVSTASHQSLPGDQV